MRLPFYCVAALPLVVAACSLDEEGLLGRGESGDAARADAPGQEASRVDAPGTDAIDHDTGAPGVGTCPSPPDCSNPACRSQGYACTPPAPSGWVLAAVDFSAEAPCPPGFGASMTMATPPTGVPAVCNCLCAPGTPPSCVSGSIEIDIGSPGVCTSPVSWSANGGVCTSASASFAPAVRVTSLPPASGGTCAASASTTLPASGSTSNYICPFVGPASTNGCTGGDVCVGQTSEQSACIIQEGASLPCPGAYTVSHQVGASVMDTRACNGGACSCGSPTATCGSPTWTFYTGSGCTGTATRVDMDGACDTTSPTPENVYASYQYTAEPTGTTCGVPSGTSAPTGSLSLVTPRTMCCLPP